MLKLLHSCNHYVSGVSATDYIYSCRQDVVNIKYISEALVTDYINYIQDVVFNYIIYIWVFKKNLITFITFQELWRYSNITCSLYPLLALDSIGPTGDTSKLINIIYILKSLTLSWSKSNFIFLFHYWVTLP